jgi:pyruvate formate lyase activating enzyme
MTKKLQIAGMNKFSTVDWPEMISAVVFLQGCPWNCSYCHNWELIDPTKPGIINESELFDLLEARKGLIDGVVFSGGDPVMQATRIIELIPRIRDLGYKIGLHTEGGSPKKFKEILPYIDWVGFDVKGPWWRENVATDNLFDVHTKFDDVTRTTGSSEDFLNSLNSLILETKARKADFPLKVQYRTTYDKALLNDEDIKHMKEKLEYHFGITELIVQEKRDIGVRGYEQEELDEPI